MKFTTKELAILVKYPHQRYVEIDKSISIKKIDKMLRNKLQVPKGYKLEFACSGTFGKTVYLHWIKKKEGWQK
jgi:hypothetical protein